MRTALAVAMLMMATAGRAAAADTGAVEGRVLDAQGAAVPGATVTVANTATGLTRTTITDGNGSYLLGAIPAGVYDITAALDGFTTIDEPGLAVNVASVVRVDFVLRIAPLNETINVVAPSPLVQATTPVVGGVVERRRIEELPLNGRQFANLAATLPGVGIGFHRDPTKGTQYMPHVGGGFGRNVNYVVDGGDNNDDEVGGMLQLFPLDAIEEFRFSIASYGAEHGRSSGGVMNVVTKSGTNTLSGSLFDFSRDAALNATTTTEQRSGVSKSDERRWQYGGSIGGALIQSTVHGFVAIERVQQNRFQPVDTQGLFPALNGVYPVNYRENLATGKVTINGGSRDRVAIRYSWNNTSQPDGAGPRVPPEAWGDNRNRFQSVNANYSRVLGRAAFNELVVQYATYSNIIAANTDRSTETFPNGVIIGQAVQAPQATVQKKLQVRNDVSWHRAGWLGFGHHFKAGGGLTHDPRLGFPSSATPPGFFTYSHLTNDPRGPIGSVSGNAGSAPIESHALNTPMTQLGVYIQDDWRAAGRLTINLGVRYDFTAGYQLDQSRNPNFVAVQQAAQAGRFNGVVGFEDFGKTPRSDVDNVQPRVGFAFDIRGNGTDVVRGGFGVYTDTAFTNGNILFAAFDAAGPESSPTFLASDPAGIRKPDGTFFRVGDPIVAIASLNQRGDSGLVGEIVSPRLEQPFARQASVGWSHQFGALTAVSADVIHTDGRKLNLRPRLNTRPNGGPRRFADVPIDPNSQVFRAAISRGTSQYDALLLSIRRRTLTGLDFAGSYTLSSAKSDFGQGVDETGLGGVGTIQDATDPFAPVAFGPTAADARHRVSLSAIVPIGWGLQVAPVFVFRSALPVGIIEGVDRNRDTINNDIPDRAYAFDGVGRPPREIGACRTVNCGRGAAFSQLNVRVSRRFTLPRGSAIVAIAEVFNAFNASNPAAFGARRLVAGTPNPDFLQPAVFAGDFQQPEQRVGQIGVRWTFGK